MGSKWKNFGIVHENHHKLSKHRMAILGSQKTSESAIVTGRHRSSTGRHRSSPVVAFTPTVRLRQHRKLSVGSKSFGKQSMASFLSEV
jgi:hypothetical protein